jgi:succinoglycan biosynthesis transport protein ExoP
MNSFDFGTFYAEVRRLWWFPVILIFGGLLAAGWLRSHEAPLYVSEAKMVIAGKINLDTGAVYTENGEDFLGTQAAIIQGDAVAVRARKIVADRGLIPPKSRVDLRVSFIPRTAIFVLSATGTDPVYTQALLEASMQAFFAVRRDMRLQRTEAASSAAAQEIVSVQQELDRGTQSLNEFQRQFSVISLTEDVTATTAYLNTLHKRIADLRLERSVAVTGSGVDASAAAAAIPLDGSISSGSTQVDGAQDRVLTTQQDLALQESERERLLKNLKPEHPKIKQLDLKIAGDKNLLTVLRSQQKDHRSDQISAIDRETEGLEKEVQQKQAHLIDLNDNLNKYQNLKSKVDSSRETSNKLVSQLQSIDVGKQLEQEPIAILESASDGTEVIKSRFLSYVQFGALGLVLALAGIALYSRLVPRFMTIEGVLRALHLPIVGKILRDPWITKQKTVLDCTPEHVGIAESFRHLRSSVLRRPQEFLAMQCVAVTSAVPREGKSLVATNLAIALAATNARTLLIDGDMRRGRLHQLLSVENGAGLSDLLTRQKGLQETLCETRMPHLYLMPCGQRIQNITEHLLSFDLAELRQELNAQFDYILIDTPPVLATTDGVALAAYADATLFVVRLGLSRPNDATMALEELKFREIRVSGLVVNAVPKHLSGRRFYADYNLLENRPFRGYGGRAPALPA